MAVTDICAAELVREPKTTYPLRDAPPKPASAAKRSTNFIAPGLFHLVTAARRSLGISATLMRLVHDDQIPSLLPDSLSHILRFA